MKAYANITSEDKLVHRQYLALMKVIRAHDIEHKTQIAKMLNMSDSCWAHRCGGERLNPAFVNAVGKECLLWKLLRIILYPM